jgi:hypothetical protein
MNFKLDPIKRFALFLMVFAGVATGYNWSTTILLHLAATLGFGLMLYALYTRFFSKHKNVWDTVITCLIIFLLLHPGDTLMSFIFPLLAVFIAETIKFFIEWKSSPIINPAAGGILLMAGIMALFGSAPFVSWWGASFWSLPIGPGISVSLLLMLVWIVGGFYVWRKWPLFFSFLIAYGALQYLRGMYGLSELIPFYLDSTIYFLAAIMLTEPKTSPFLPWKQVAYGALAALIYVTLLHFGVPYAELFAIVGANLFNAALKWTPTPKMATAA